MFVSYHVLYRQVLDYDDRLGFRQSGRELVQEVSPLVSDFAVQSRQFNGGFLAVIGTVLLSRKMSGEPAELL